MKKMIVAAALMVLCLASGAFAADIAALDKVSVLMSKAQVVSILGAPDETVTLANGLKVDVYHVSSALPLIHSGCIYDQAGLLMGQSFVFEGNAAGEIIGRLKKHGFVPLPKKENIIRFSGFDDDTGRPLIAVIDETDSMTTVTTFEKAFYEAKVK
jgi:hypothetical protein